MESGNRNSQGRFVSGHKGAKPKGAINKSTRDYLAYLDKISSLLEANLPDNINSLSAKDQVMFWFEIEKFKQLKMSKFTGPEPEKDLTDKIIINIVGADGKIIDTPPLSPATPAAAVTAPPQPAPVPPADNAPIQYGAIDVGRVRSRNFFPRSRSF